jgi:hypothetical protein
MLTLHLSSSWYSSIGGTLGDACQPLDVQTSKDAHRDQHDEELSTNTPSIRPRLVVFLIIFVLSSRVTDPRLAAFALSRLANILAECSNRIASGTILADQKPTNIITIGRPAANRRCVLPDQLGEVSSFGCEFAFLVIVIAFFVGPAVDGKSG